MSSNRGKTPSKDGRPRTPHDPTPAHQAILDAYFLNRNAAAVAGALGCSERNVRRVVHRYAERTASRDRERAAEQQGRAHARQAKIDEWADRELDETLAGIDRLTTSDNPVVAIRALKLRLDIARRGDSAPVIHDDPDLAEVREAKRRDLAQRLRSLEEGASLDGGGR